MVAAMPFPLGQGSQVYAGGMARALVRRGHRVILATYAHGVGRDPEGVEVVRAAPVPGGDLDRSGLHWSRPLQDALLARVVGRVLRRARVDLVHAHNVEAPLAAALGMLRARTRVPLVYNLHTLMGEELPTYLPRRLGGVAGRAGSALDAVLPRLADGSVALSQRGLEALRERGARRVVFVPPGLDLADLDGADGARARDRHHLGDAPWVAYVGNADAYQDLGVLLRAVAASRTLRLLVVSGSDLSELTAEADSLGIPAARRRLVRDGSWFAARDALAASAVAVVPRGTCAGFPIKLLNQLGLGVPTVTARGSWQPIDGQVVVPNGEPEALCHALEALVADPDRRRALGEAGRAHVARDYTWVGAAARLEDWYRQLTG